MNILICHERFLFRFGADRVLILLGKGLKERGHTVTAMGNRCDPEVVASFAERWIETPVEGVHLELNEFTRDWLSRNWRSLFPAGGEPEVVIVGGWPFFAAIPFFREISAQVIFIDCGVVPNHGYSEEMVTVLEKLHGLRRQYLPSASASVAISRFIADSQTRADAGDAVPIRPILLGADHMELSMWQSDQLPIGDRHSSGTVLLQNLKAQGKKVLLNLGRWEPACYKNSEAAFDIISQICATRPDCALLVLEQPGNLEVPDYLRDFVYPIGFPDDRELLEMMKSADLGISVSRWEGFNLPLAEMQWYGRPVLAFDLAAHPEVILHPWYLCRDASDMSRKALEILNGGGPPSAELASSLKWFRTYFRWQRFTDECAGLLAETESQQGKAAAAASALSVDVSYSVRDSANSGVVRVARRLGRKLQESGFDPVFVVWDEPSGHYVFPTEAEYEMLGRFNGPVFKRGMRVSKSAEERTYLAHVLTGLAPSEHWLLLPETIFEGSFRRRRQYARERKFRTAVIFFDAIPVLRPELCNEVIRNNHRAYMLGIAECDLAVPISRFSADCLRNFWRDSGAPDTCRIVTDVLPGEFGGARRIEAPLQRNISTVRILCVSTLEPRKNHRNLVHACLRMAENHPELDWSLTLVGNKYHGSFEIAEWIQEVSTREPRIQWLGIVDDPTLDRLYESAAFTVYPSLIEGFGLPILESIWHGRPCICYNQGVMSELAQAGGCLTTDVTDPVRLSEAIYSLAANEDLRLRLSREAAARTLKTWNDYVSELMESLRSFECLQNQKLLESALYPHCLCDNWQMHDSERMGLMALLARHKPVCSIEIGTYGGGSLSLIAQYSNFVFSIDIDESIPGRFQFPNVSFLTGPSTLVLPQLFAELDRAGIAVDFVLIDGDHSAEGVKGDIACLLQYVPKRPLFVVLHDSFNPGCRSGMLESPWAKSPYCHAVDLDFIPGRVSEYEGPFQGQLWGGLALAYFLPERRAGGLQIRTSANQMLQRLSVTGPNEAEMCLTSAV
jgi:glycosyltransferase involved in cell wall biosynthesis